MRRPFVVLAVLLSGLVAGCSDPAPSSEVAPPEPHANAAAPKVAGAAASAARTGLSAGDGGRATGSSPAPEPERASARSATAAPPVNAQSSETTQPERVATTPESRKAREDTVLADAETLLATPRFGDFRSAAARYLEIVREMQPLDQKFAAGTIEESERETYWKLNDKKTAAWSRVHEVMFRDGFSREDRRAMGQWISIKSTRAE